MSRKKNVFLIVLGSASACLIAYGLLVQKAHSLIEDRLRTLGYDAPVITQPRVFLDGVKVDRIDVEKNKTVENIFIEANPFQILMRQPRFISIEKIDITFERPFQDEIRFIGGVPFQVEKAVLRFPGYQNLVIEAKPKQISSDTVVLELKGRGTGFSFQGSGDIHFNGKALQTVNVDFSTIHIDQKNIRTKRSDGWLSLFYKDKNQWIANGEAGAGYANVSTLALADAVLTVNGPVSSYSWILNGKEKKSGKFVTVEGSTDQRMHALFEKKELSFKDSFLDNFKKLALVIPLKEEKKEEASRKTVQTTKQKTEKEDIEKKTTEQKPIIIPLVKKSFHTLVKGSFFEGFHYSQKMTTIDVPCTSSSVHTCWAARARGGIFGYEEYAIPSYLTRLQDYEQARLLSGVLRSMQIKTLALQGIGNQLQKMMINGMAPGEQPVYIELSVSDVN